MRFGFGENWMNYVETISEAMILASRNNLKALVNINFSNISFLDVGCGSGIHSLAAVLEGAKVFSFDYDRDSVLASEKVREYKKISKELWHIEKGDILDLDYTSTLQKYDVVYTWGALHHTGKMWDAIHNTSTLVTEEGYLCIAIYNDQGWKSKFWWAVKYIYNKLPAGLNKVYAYILGTAFILLNILKYTILLKPMKAIGPLLKHNVGRGMNILHDMVDWYGGYPYEYASVEALNTFLKIRGFIPTNIIETDTLGCNQILYKRQ